MRWSASARDPVTLTTLAAKGRRTLRAMATGRNPIWLWRPNWCPPHCGRRITPAARPSRATPCAAIKGSSDAQFRNIAIAALAAARDPEANAEIEEFIASGALTVREQGTYMREAFADAERRAGVWAWLRKDFKRISAPVPARRAARASSASPPNSATDQSRAEIEWFFKPMVGEISGAPRVYANTLETVDRCVAWRKAKGPRTRRCPPPTVIGSGLTRA